MLAPPPLPRNLEAAIRDLNSQKPATRASAVADLARHASRDDATRERALPLFEKALSDDVSTVRSAAAIALADVKGTEALSALLIAVEDADQHVRQMAISALGEIGDARAAQRLERALADKRPEVRYQALIAFARVARAQPKEVLGAIARGLADEDDAIRYIALRIAEEETIPGDDSLVARAAALLDDPHPSVKLAAAIFLARKETSEASQKSPGRAIVLAAVRGDLPRAEREDLQAAVELTGELAMSEAVPHLERRAWGLGSYVRDTCGWHAKIALARMDHPRATAEIVKDLSSWRRETREAAVVAAGRGRVREAKEKLASLEAGSVDADLLAEALRHLEEPTQ